MLVKTDESESIFNVRIGWSSADPDNGKDLIVTIDDVTRIKENKQRMFELQGFADKGIMASSIAHELNNFLALLMAGVQMTQLSIKRGDSGKTAVTLDKLMENVRKMKRFTMGLTDFGMLGSSMQNANLNDIITDVLSFVKVQKRFTRIKLTANLDFNLPVMLMDTDQMSQLLLNFLNNAADAIAGLGRTDGAIGLTTSQTDNLIILTVADNGSGIDPEIKDKLFKEQLTTKEDGHGFGLMTCARILESHGGKISFKSAVGEGTTFRFEFPKEYDPE